MLNSILGKICLSVLKQTIRSHRARESIKRGCKKHYILSWRLRSKAQINTLVHKNPDFVFMQPKCSFTLSAAFPLCSACVCMRAAHPSPLSNRHTNLQHFTHPQETLVCYVAILSADGSTPLAPKSPEHSKILRKYRQRTRSLLV